MARYSSSIIIFWTSARFVFHNGAITSMSFLYLTVSKIEIKNDDLFPGPLSSLLKQIPNCIAFIGKGLIQCSKERLAKTYIKGILQNQLSHSKSKRCHFFSQYFSLYRSYSDSVKMYKIYKICFMSYKMVYAITIINIIIVCINCPCCRSQCFVALDIYSKFL